MTAEAGRAEAELSGPPACLTCRVHVGTVGARVQPVTLLHSQPARRRRRLSAEVKGHRLEVKSHAVAYIMHKSVRCGASERKCISRMWA